MPDADQHDALADKLAPVGVAKLRELEATGHCFKERRDDPMGAVCLTDGRSFAEHGRPVARQSVKA